MKIHRTFPRCLSVITIFLALAGLLQADVVDHSGANGSFTDSMWFDQTTGMHGVNPKPGDDAYFYASTITASGGNVHLLSGGTLSLSGMFTAVNVGDMTLSGSGTLNLQTVVTDANGFGPILNVTGAHLNVQNGNGIVDVTAGGTVIAAACSGTDGCGFYNGAGTSLTLSGLGGPGRAIFSSGGKLTANSGLTGFTLQLMSGSTATVSSMTNSLVTIDGAGSRLTVAGDVSLNPQSINISNGGAAIVNGNLTQLEGGPLFVTGTAASLTVGKDLKHNTGSDTDIRIYTGGTARVEGNLVQTRGNVQVDAANSALTVDQDIIDQGGFVDITNGATLTVNGDLVLDGGFDLDGDAIGGGGNWSGAGTTINTSEAMFIGNQNSGGANLFVGSKAAVKSGNVTIAAVAGVPGGVAMSDLGTIWEVQSNGMSIGENGTGTFTIDSGAHLKFDSGTLLAIGFDSGSRGTLRADSGVIDATAALVAIGEEKGSSGNMVLTDSTFSTAKDFVVGDSGSGGLTLSGASSVKVSGSATTFFVGNKSGSTGSVSVNGTQSTLTSAGPTSIGVAGKGFLGAGGGATINLTNSAELILGSSKTGNGTIVLDGANTKLTLSSDLILGNLGVGSLSITGGAQIALAGGNEVNLSSGVSKGGSGTITVDGSSFTDNLPIVIGRKGVGIFNAMNGASLNIFGFTAPFADGGQATITVDGSNWVNTYNIYLGGLVANDPPSTLLLKNRSTMRVGDRMTIFQAGAVTIDKTSMMAVGSGAFGPGGSVRVSTGGILSGYGRVNGQVIVASGGQIFPGNSPGVLTIGGDYEQDAGATYSAEIGGANAGSYDQIKVTGKATLGGVLRVRLVNGFTPAVGQTFRLVDAASESGNFAIISQPSQAGISLTSDASGMTVKITSVVAGAPVISSPTTLNAASGMPLSYQINATNNPTSFGATDLPPGLTVNHSTGYITGTPTNTGAFVVPINANNAAGSAQADLTINVDPVFGTAPAASSTLLNISTRLDVQSGDNVLIDGFIITGTAPKKVLIRGLGPSLGGAGVVGVLADPVLELHKPDMSVVTNDNWMDTQKAAIVATGIPPTNNLESAIVATLSPGAYTAILRGKNNGAGIGLVEVYDLDQAAASELANISTRGFVQTGDNIMIGGFIIGGGGGSSTILVRGIGPSLGGANVANPLEDPTLELHDSNGAVVGFDDDWQDAQEAAIKESGVPPTNPREAAIEATLAPGNYTAVLRGKSNGTGVGLVEAYNLH